MECSTTWAMKKKSSGNLRGRLNAVRGFKQLEGQHYIVENIFSTVTNPVTICMHGEFCVPIMTG
eukprot:scaffold96112_cov23-Cyclotella_meneghiniana.AAC.1